MTKQPIVSVIMPVYNGAKYIRQAVESVFRQDVLLELIVVDDGSSDGTEEIMKEYLGRDDFCYLRNEKNAGVATSRNRGTRAARGEYVAYLDADDWWEDGKLKHQLQVLKDTGAVLCSTGRELMNSDGTSTGKYIPVKQRISYRELLKHNSINCSSVLIKREVALEFPMEHDDSHEDYLAWLKVLRKYEFGVGIDQPYLKYRLSEGGKSRNKWKSAVMSYKVYRYMGYNTAESILYFISYAVHGIWKYC